jgi:DNA-directed RNA polymerase specialized sigma24 family protein
MLRSSGVGPLCFVLDGRGRTAETCTSHHRFYPTRAIAGGGTLCRSLNVAETYYEFMSDEHSLPQLALTNLAQRCAHETELFFQRQSYDSRYCFELFRRAILDGNREAWELIYSQYQWLVLKWVSHHPAFSAVDEEPRYFVNRAFESMWSALTPEKFSRFPDLKSILRYLQMCVHSVIIDEVRRTGLPNTTDLSDELETNDQLAVPGVEEEALEGIQRRALWENLQARLHDEKERKAIYGSFILNLKPQELCAAFPDTFQNVQEIYRTKQNVLDRLRRDQGFLEILSPEGGKTSRLAVY